MNNKILPTHQARRAVVYLRQSTLKQVHEHRESTARQYALKQRAVDLGWPVGSVDVVDDDLGQSGSTTTGRAGFQRVAEVLWQTGAVSELTVARRGPGEANTTAPAVAALIRQRVAEGRGDGEIAAELARLAVKTGARGEWSVPAVRRVRYGQGIHRVSRKSRRPPDRREDGLYSLNGVAAQLGVMPGLVRTWVRNGWLTAVEGSGTGHTQWFRMGDEVLGRLDEAKRRSAARRSGEETQV